MKRFCVSLTYYFYIRMEDADKLMLRTLRDLDCEITEEASSLAELSTEQVREGEVREECHLHI